MGNDSMGSAEMLSDNLVDYDVTKTTTDKLQDLLNGYSDPWAVRQIEYLGGRDWLVIAVHTWDTLVDKCNAYGEDIETWAPEYAGG